MSDVIESNTLPTHFTDQMADQPFHKQHRDLRYKTVNFHEFTPGQTIGSNTLTFKLPAWTAPVHFLLNDMMLTVTMKIAKPDNTPPIDAAVVYPVNNVLHSLFKSCKLTLGDKPTSANEDNYNYKAYLATVLSYSEAAKMSHLQSQGYYIDTPTHFDATDATNDGGVNRGKLFKEDDQDWEEVTFTGRLYHGLVSCDTGLLNGVSVKVELQRAEDQFVLMRPATDNIPYKVTLTSASLHVPCAELKDEIAASIERTLEKEDAKYYFRRLEVVKHSIPQGACDWQSEILYPEKILPCKIVAVFLPTPTMHGRYDKNPFSFKRKWGTEGDDLSYVKSVTCTLNGKKLHTLTEKATEAHDINSFYCMNLFSGFIDSQLSCGIEYQDYLSDYFIHVFDLTTSGKGCGMEGLLPAVKLGCLRINVEFSSAIPLQLNMLTMNEFPSLLTINKKRKINLSYDT